MGIVNYQGETVRRSVIRRDANGDVIKKANGKPERDSVVVPSINGHALDTVRNTMDKAAMFATDLDMDELSTDLTTAADAVNTEMDRIAAWVKEQKEEGVLVQGRKVGATKRESRRLNVPTA